MLLRLRKVRSEALSTQIIGRIRRNPLPNIKDIDCQKFNFVNKYYIFSNKEADHKQFIFLSLKKEFKAGEQNQVYPLDLSDQKEKDQKIKKKIFKKINSIKT